MMRWQILRETVLGYLKDEGITWKELCERHGLDYDKEGRRLRRFCSEDKYTISLSDSELVSFLSYLSGYYRKPTLVNLLNEGYDGDDVLTKIDLTSDFVDFSKGPRNIEIAFLCWMDRHSVDMLIDRFGKQAQDALTFLQSRNLVEVDENGIVKRYKGSKFSFHTLFQRHDFIRLILNRFEGRESELDLCLHAMSLDTYKKYMEEEKKHYRRQVRLLEEANDADKVIPIIRVNHTFKILFDEQVLLQEKK